MKIWFQNRRTKWKKHENITATELPEHKLQAAKNPDVAKAIQNAAKLRKAKERLEVTTSNNGIKKDLSNQPLDFSMEKLDKLQNVNENMKESYLRSGEDFAVNNLKTEYIEEKEASDSSSAFNDNISDEKENVDDDYIRETKISDENQSNSAKTALINNQIAEEKRDKGIPEDDEANGNDSADIIDYSVPYSNASDSS